MSACSSFLLTPYYFVKCLNDMDTMIEPLLLISRIFSYHRKIVGTSGFFLHGGLFSTFTMVRLIIGSDPSSHPILKPQPITLSFPDTTWTINVQIHSSKRMENPSLNYYSSNLPIFVTSPHRLHHDLVPHPHPWTSTMCGGGVGDWEEAVKIEGFRLSLAYPWRAGSRCVLSVWLLFGIFDKTTLKN